MLCISCRSSLFLKSVPIIQVVFVIQALLVFMSSHRLSFSGRGNGMSVDRCFWSLLWCELRFLVAPEWNLTGKVRAGWRGFEKLSKRPWPWMTWLTPELHNMPEASNTRQTCQAYMAHSLQLRQTSRSARYRRCWNAGKEAAGYTGHFPNHTSNSSQLLSGWFKNWASL